MSKKTGRKSGFWLGLCFVFAVLSFVVSFPASGLSVFYGHLNSFSYGVRNYDRDEVEKGLKNLENDYNVFSGWKLRYFADRWLFDKMYRYEAAVSIVNEDYEKAEETLKDHGDDYYASYMLGIAKFKTLRPAFQQATAKKDKEQMAAILVLVLKEVSPDFEKCVKEGPGPADNFNCSFDYDLTSNPESALKALMSQKPVPQYVLGIPGGKNPNDGEPEKKGPPRLNPNEKKDSGQGGSQKVG